ncbi:MAG: DNA repair protein RecO [Desulfuromonas sp.]|nr:MAG: DNA repair protein RecO [Desulfuromonas sp.]
MRSQHSDAIILRHTPYGEADLVVSFFTPGHGVLKGFARNARRSRKRFGPALELFAQTVMHWTERRRGELLELKEAELVNLRSGLRGNLEALAFAGYGVEVSEELAVAGGDQGAEYRLLKAYLDHLHLHGASRAARLLLELRLLQLSGTIPHLLHCAECYTVFREGEVAFEAARGGSLCSACASRFSELSVHVTTLGSLSRCLQTRLELFEGFSLSAQTLDEGLRMTASALAPHFSRPLRSLAFLAEIEGGGDAGERL